MKRAFFFIALMWTVAVQGAQHTPSDVPNPKDRGQAYYVANPDALLVDSDVVWLNRCAERLYQETQVELCVTALESIGETDAFDFAYELFQRWGIGGEGRNTGVLVLFVLDSRDIRIMTGVGIEGVLTDAQCSQIIREQMTPAFRDGDYGGGLCLGALRIYEICTDGDAPEELRNAQSVTDRGIYAEDEEMKAEEVVFVLLITLLIAVICFVWAWFSSVKKCPHCHKRKAHATGEKVLLHPSFTHEGKGERTYRCSHCGHTFVMPFAIPRKSRIVITSGGSGGGFSGGGGGFSGGSWGGGSTMGGGAGGKW